MFKSFLSAGSWQNFDGLSISSSGKKLIEYAVSVSCYTLWGCGGVTSEWNIAQREFIEI